jgi:hypothetical protein
MQETCCVYLAYVQTVSAGSLGAFPIFISYRSPNYLAVSVHRLGIVGFSSPPWFLTCEVGSF